LAGLSLNRQLREVFILELANFDTLDASEWSHEKVIIKRPERGISAVADSASPVELGDEHLSVTLGIRDYGLFKPCLSRSTLEIVNIIRGFIVNCLHHLWMVRRLKTSRECLRRAI
jgi:hypothetical protein